MHLIYNPCLQCSVTCGSGQQTREVTCMGSDGTSLDETSCSALLRPATVQRCEMASCPQQISWHVGDWGLVNLMHTCNQTRTHKCSYSSCMGEKLSPFSCSALRVVDLAHESARWSALIRRGTCTLWTSVTPSPNHSQWSAATPSPVTAHRVSKC